MRLRFIVLGFEVWSLELDNGEVEYTEAEEGGAELPDGVGGGSGMCFERDGNPLSPVGEEPWPWDTDRGGFGFQA